MESAGRDIPTEGFDLFRALGNAARWLPAQGPIKDFVHHNPLHAFQHLPFHDAVDAASRLYGAAAYLPLRFYLKAFHERRISDSALTRALQKEAGDLAEVAALRAKMLSPDGGPHSLPRGIARTGLRARWKAREVNLESRVRPTLFKLVSNFLDQGISVWRMPYADDSFWTAVGRILEESQLPLPPLSDARCRRLFSGAPEEAALFCLGRLVGSELLYERYLLEMLLSHPGWSGMIHQVERAPASLLERRRITLMELVALELTLEYGWASRLLGPAFPPVGDEKERPDPLPTEDHHASRTESQRLLERWQEALEWTLYRDVLSALELRSVPARARKSSAQIFFCLDDRSESLRRHMEEVDGTIDTFGTAGYFGVDFLYQGFEDSYPVRSCPVTITPRHLVRESKIKESRSPRPRLADRLQINASSNTLFRGWLITQTLGLGHSLRLALQVFSPSPGPTEEKRLSSVKANTRLHILRESDSVTEDGYLLGYSYPEMADRVFGILTSTGLTHDFADLIVIVGHGSSSANNPHFAAYDCGACSGKPGAPNARAFAWMANRNDVRAILKERGISIPESTFFLPALHDTARDEVHYFDVDTLPSRLQEAFRKFDVRLQEALRRNAKERCRRFELAMPPRSPLRALRTVRERSTSIFEPRPELNHATNAICLVGRRDLSRGLFLDRRCFLNSYDPEQDPRGEILSGILDAVVPVCGGINLEYFFSRVDNGVYGAGTKLPHNIVSLVGVANGVEGDLRTGLPSQMTEVHDPVRLLLIVEQTPEIAVTAATKNPKTFAWIRNDWVRFACLTPRERKAYFFEKGEFVRCEWNRTSIPRAPDSLSVAERDSGNIPVHEIGVGP